ncbi:MAG: hypothetical protein BZ138_08085 [Methanosphaera sp. rholeuAM270]|nr:MAG: hypothetical protein BZ138_08085 [Methanosphaera sp. rholeuAM270]
MLNLTYDISKIEYSFETWGMKEDIGGRKIVTYVLLLNKGTDCEEVIGEFTFDKEDVPEKELIQNFLQKKILSDSEELMTVMNYLNTVVPDEEFFTEICEDDFYSGTKHDIRNPEIINHPETRSHGRELNGTYSYFLKQHLNELESLYN